MYFSSYLEYSRKHVRYVCIYCSHRIYFLVVKTLQNQKLNCNMMPMLDKFYLEKNEAGRGEESYDGVEVGKWFFYIELSTLASLRWHWARDLNGSSLCEYMGPGKQGNKCKDSEPERRSGV